LTRANAGAALGEVKSLLAVHRSAEALPLAEELVAKAPEDVEALVAAAKARAATGDAGSALTRCGRPRLARRTAPISTSSRVTSRSGRDGRGARRRTDPRSISMRASSGVARAGRLHEQDEEWLEAQRAYEAALEALPTFHEAALALADLLRRSAACARP